MSKLIETDHLTRFFGNICAVDGVTFSVSQGDVLGFLGPNGAGKSTTMKMLTGFLTPSAGTAKIGGFDISEQPLEAKRLVGYLPENAPLYGEMTPLKFLRFIAEVRDIPAEQRSSSIERVVNLTSIERVVSQPIETLSKGYKRRVGLAQALLHDPQILILDEPTDGLDPNQKHEVRNLIRSMAKDKCIVLSTHILEEVDAVCSRAIIISKGRLVTDSTPEKLRKSSKSRGALSVTFPGGLDENLKTQLRRMAGVANVKFDDGGPNVTTLLPLPNQDLLRSFLKEAETNQWKFEGVRVDAGQLDEVFRNLTQ
jgi:ABC-2 type transport system ATP-binding protein